MGVVPQGRGAGVELKIQIASQLLRCGKNFLLTYNTYAALQNEVSVQGNL